MGTINRTLGERIQYDDERVCWKLREWGVRLTVDQYRLLRFALQFIAIGTIVLTAIYPNMSLPDIAYIVLGAIALGPNVAEAYLTRNS